MESKIRNILGSVSIIKKEVKWLKSNKNNRKKVMEVRKKLETYGLLSLDKILIRVEVLLLLTKYMNLIQLWNNLPPRIINIKTKNYNHLQHVRQYRLTVNKRKNKIKNVPLLFKCILTDLFFIIIESLISDIIC